MVKATELWNILQDLGEDEFKHFKWFLKQDDILEGCTGIPVARLEKAERQDTVDLMVQKYQGSGALKLTLKVLENIYRNDLVQRLQNSSPGAKDVTNHGSVLLKSDYEKQKAELGAKIKLMIQERQMKIGEIRHSADLSSKSADRHIADSEQVFTALLQSVKTSLDTLIEAINEKRKETQKQAKEFIQELEQEISELTKKSTKMEQLSRTEDHPDFLNLFSSLNAIPTTKNWTEVTIPPPSYGGSVGATMNQLEEKFSKEKKKLIDKAKLNRVQQFTKDVTLDPDTANPYLILSDDGKQVYCGGVKQNLPDNPERFNTASNVLGKQSFSSGRFYYEVLVKGKTSWDLGVVKESINRKGSITASPMNGYWTMCLRTGVGVKYPPKKVGVFVDYDKGSVSFYDVDTADIIQKFNDCSFTEKLYPFFSPGPYHGGKNSTPLIISPVNYND
ncbi:E3 ubiquitin-protein ligase TRIM21 [Dicentrarchus labrax]|uniref:E3 ubiquitin-protein ligase TRIM21 n=1 Tax=Dicentrarchus labrax TaxID=13489 RepID=UPI0021F502A1|nr:E3 ubiquitin-protein ligase TRIM21 [Dicentrarchus labrax]XP_051247721.1 E3 ubiquitin-protein ligase TRIM21 [Dicentrarchus labrax]XP_051247722.1 E3 ubiquitin-protein ligase TRIM21 [Dicentrarchus labrax]XP_051247723.1 E3 ubiquitin-protein ligase TRIM21 [Dicentrarchus labrax]XP_051247724.1 E3 ubiquitin-protein ligase TRIM21 [Dicentrarchus labrax]XP_051247725.1 E3 ubiquitin-protein ligase TRIM21 [Dicentrarchus labrax]XP_051247726.1 E3 ubiquitin-protein ligase TRIM21 [Dicentrarchus labrax]XP_0